MNQTATIDLEAMRDVDIRTFDRSAVADISNIKVNTAININDLADIRDVEIDPSLPQEERMKSYLQQIKNPHLYRCGDMIVRVSFAKNGATLADRLKQYLLSGQGLTL